MCDYTTTISIQNALHPGVCTVHVFTTAILDTAQVNADLVSVNINSKPMGDCVLMY